MDYPRLAFPAPIVWELAVPGGDGGRDGRGFGGILVADPPRGTPTVTAAANADPAAAGDPPVLAVHGAAGRMGRQLLAVAASQGDRVRGAWVPAGSVLLGRPVGPDWPGLVWARPDRAAAPEVVIDFSRADAFPEILAWCRTHGVALVSGTTGLDAGQRAEMARAGVNQKSAWVASQLARV